MVSLVLADMHVLPLQYFASVNETQPAVTPDEQETRVNWKSQGDIFTENFL